MRQRVLVAFLMSLSSMSLVSQASAGPYEDAFAKCLVESSSPRDNIVLIKWIARLIIEHPDLQSIGQIAEEAKSNIDSDLAKYFERILTIDCVNEGKMAAKVEGSDLPT